MPTFTILSRVDAFVDYLAHVDAEDAQAATDLAYEGGPGVVWQERGVVKFDARRVVTLDAAGEEIESTARGDL